MSTIYQQSILENQRKMDRKFKRLRGLRIATPDGQVWEFVRTNDVGYPYFVKIVRGKKQKTEYTVAGYSRKWLERQ